MNHSKTKRPVIVVGSTLIAFTLICCSVGFGKLKKSMASYSGPAVVQVADGVAPSPPPPPPPPRGVTTASQA
jgi:hypothetical protein